MALPRFYEKPRPASCSLGLESVDNEQVTAIGPRAAENGGQRGQNSARAQSMVLFVAFAVALYRSWLLIRPFLWVLTWAVVMAVLFYPVHEQLRKWVSSPGWSAVLSTLLVIVTVLAPTAMVVRSVAGEVQTIAR